MLRCAGFVAVVLVCDGCVGCGGCAYGCGGSGGCEERILYRKLSSKIHVYLKLIFYLKCRKASFG